MSGRSELEDFGIRQNRYGVGQDLEVDGIVSVKSRDDGSRTLYVARLMFDIFDDEPFPNNTSWTHWRFHDGGDIENTAHP